MISIIIASLKSAAINMIGLVLTEKLFSKVLARLTVSLLERIAKSTKTDIDDKAIKPIIKQLKDQY